MIPVSMSHGYLHGRPPDGGGHPGYQPIFMSINHGAAPQPVHQPPPVQAVNSVCQVGPMISQGGQVNPLSPGIQMLVPQHPIHYVTHSSASHHEPQLHQPPQDERSDLKLLSKRLSNRKSARVSRARKKAVEEELTRTNEEMKLHARLLKVLPDPILSVDKAGTIQYASPACATHFLAPETEMLGASIFKWVSRESRTLIQRHILDLFASCNDNSNSNTAPEPAQLWIHPQSIFNIKIKRQDGSSLKCSISSNLRCEPSEKDEKKEEPIEAILVLRPNERPKLRKKLQSNVLLRTSENINRGTRLGAGPGVKRECPPAAAAAARPPLPPPPRPPLAGTPPRGPGRPAMPSPPPSASSRSRSRSPSSSPSPSPRKQPGGKRRRGELTPHHPALAALGLLGGVGGGGGGGGGAPAPGPGPMAVLGLGLDQRVPSLVAAVPMHPGLPAGWGPSAPAAAAPGDALAAAAAAAAAGRGKGERRRHPKGSSRRDRGPLQPPAGGEGAARRRPRPPAAASSSSSSSPPPSLSAGRRRGEGPSAATLEARLLSLLNGQALPAEEGRCSPPPPPRREEPHPAAAAAAAAAPLSPPAAAPAAAAAATVAASPLAEAEDLSSAVTSLFLLRHRQHPPGAG